MKKTRPKSRTLQQDGYRDDRPCCETCKHSIIFRDSGVCIKPYRRGDRYILPTGVCDAFEYE